MVLAEYILIEIEQKREEMINLAHASGFTSPDTIKASQELDELMNAFLFGKHTYSKVC
ncbi:aspartyl-phosphate phosphatase Spo0E family protein [Bacillus sp. V5-8f]|uniref:aspartyl-phosphate phosphatase Spo0E family protein n=1 Tax=Bacillus sp. V5-8f TaxID=2053044 RepID=UPI000C77EAB3|nr:aspartyl-phosphate phosphatase Spo0E family protein [Bacillus sp. V5-8f]PLT34434.1 aspartyl-phosphate phosphatase Spo0E family protein [Bacillus sp. V5-8f]